LGTGSGAIALAIASERTIWSIVATDSSESAIRLAATNAQRLHISNIEFFMGDWCLALPDCLFDLIVSNPPYIAENDSHLQQGDVAFEPVCALVGGTEGIELINKIAKQAQKFLKPGGFLLFEHGCDQGLQVKEILMDLGYKNVTMVKDVSGHERITYGGAI